MEEYYSIGKISKKCNVTIKTLRYYDQIGLLKPEYRDEATNYRYYTKKQMIDVLVIRRLRALDISIDDIKVILSKPSISNYINIISNKSKEISSEIKLLEAKKSACNVILDRMIKGNDILSNNSNDSLSLTEFTKNVQFEYIPESKILYSRKIMKNYNNAEVSLDRWIDIYERCTNNGISMQSPIMTTYYSDPLAQFLLQDCDVEFSVIIDKSNNINKSKSKTRMWGKFDACTAYHFGNYSEIIQSHVSLIQYIHKNGYEVSGPISEIFIVSPLDIKDGNRHITKIIMPIDKKS